MAAEVEEPGWQDKRSLVNINKTSEDVEASECSIVLSSFLIVNIVVLYMITIKQAETYAQKEERLQRHKAGDFTPPEHQAADELVRTRNKS